MEEEVTTVGWDAIEQAMVGLYGDQEPKHYGSSIPYERRADFSGSQLHGRTGWKAAASGRAAGAVDMPGPDHSGESDGDQGSAGQCGSHDRIAGRRLRGRAARSRCCTIPIIRTRQSSTALSSGALCLPLSAPA